uniref:Putative secreted protein n=1 Tax=Anopheles darlingi TaxID=43151 RepID=A0A2M4D894_ANODA
MRPHLAATRRRKRKWEERRRLLPLPLPPLSVVRCATTRNIGWCLLVLIPRVRRKSTIAALPPPRTIIVAAQ